MTAAKSKTPWRLRTMRGLASSLATPLMPVGGFWVGDAHRRGDPKRLEKGLAIVLPGIEGRGPLSWNICKGIEDAGFDGAVVLWDWTTGLWPLFLYHLRNFRRNVSVAIRLAEFILDYEKRYSGRPIYLVGHSGGGAMTVLTLGVLPPREIVTAAVLLGPALSRDYDLAPALQRVKLGLWNHWSYGDAFLCGAGTVVCGCVDGKHTFSAGFRGFSPPANEDSLAIYKAKLKQVCYSPRFAKQFHLGGHFGLANRVFVAETVWHDIATAASSHG